MTLTIELPESVVERAAGWTPEALSKIAVDAVVRHLQDVTLNDEPVGEFLPLTEEIPMDSATLEALHEARADHEAGRYHTSEEVRAFIMSSLAIRNED